MRSHNHAYNIVCTFFCL